MLCIIKYVLNNKGLKERQNVTKKKCEIEIQVK